jgi:tRNA G18 (ribose-2'-O)-methylase SpoU
MPLDPPLDATPEEIKRALEPLRNGVSLAVHTLGNPFAVGAIIRICHSFLVREIILIGNEPHYEKASMGMHKLEHIVRVDEGDALFEYAGQRPVWALERERCRRSLYGVASFPDDVVLVAGSERFGFPPGFLERCGDVIGIPLYGANNSLPVAVAVGITLSYWASVRYAPGSVVAGPPRSR